MMYTPYASSSSDTRRFSSETVPLTGGTPAQPGPSLYQQHAPPPTLSSSSFAPEPSGVGPASTHPTHRHSSYAPPSSYSSENSSETPQYYGRQSLQHRTPYATAPAVGTAPPSWTPDQQPYSATIPASNTTSWGGNVATRLPAMNDAPSNISNNSYPHASLTWVCLLVDVALWLHLAPSLLSPLLAVALVWYAIDLVNAPTLLLTVVTLSVLSLMVASVVVTDNWGGGIVLASLTAILSLAITLHLGLVLCFTSSAATASSRLSQQLQQQLAGVVPLITSAFVTQSLATATWSSSSSSAVVLPLTFALALLTLSYLYHSDSSISHVHRTVGVLTPVCMYVVACVNRLVSHYVGMDDVYELLLVSTLPLLGVMCLPTPPKTTTPPTIAPRYRLVVRTALAVVAFLSLQQRYILAMAHAFAYHFLGHEPSVGASSLYGLVAVLSTVGSAALWTGQLPRVQMALGDYHEDMVQLGLALAGLCVGKLFGLSWSFTPLPILAFLGWTLWIATRMFRYLAIFLFVWHATGVVIFTYRFAGMDHVVTIVGQIHASLMRFGYLVVLTSILAGLVAGLAVRSSGGIGHSILKRLQVVGILLTVYSVLLLALEITLLKRPVPTTELAGVEPNPEEEDNDDETLYQSSYAVGTALILVVLSLYMQRVKLLAPTSALVVLALNLGKAVCLYMDAVAPSDSQNDDEQDLGWGLFLQTIVAAVLILVMFAPQVLLEPYHSKIKRRRSSLTATELPIETRRVTYLYSLVVLPLTLVAAIPTVLFPLAQVLAETYQSGLYATSTYSSKSLPILELLASTMALWGVATLSMLNHYLPDETTGQGFKKLSAFAFLIGTLLFLVSPILGSGLSAKALSDNPYAAMSSLGSQMLTGKKRRTGGWGLMSAALATLLALSGPLELRERRVVSVTGQSKKDRFLLLRTMIFGLLFGGGVAWFVVLQNMRDVELGSLIFVGMSCLSVACMGTVAAVLGYFLDLEVFDDAEQVIQFSLILTAILLPVSWCSTFFTPNSHWFGSDGWLSTYLVVVSITYLAIAVSLRIRPTKNAKTCGVANTLGLLAWGVAVTVVYGRYGVSGLDANYDIRLVLGVPASIVATFLLAPMLLVLEGESSALRRSAVKRISVGNGVGGASSTLGTPLTNLRTSNRWFPLFFGSSVFLLLASAYAILLRGSGILGFVGGPAIAKSPEEVSTNVYGSVKQGHDLASLTQLAISHSQALTASAKLAGCSFWTAPSLLFPLLHMAGLLAVLPSLYLVTRQWWFRKSVPVPSLVLALPLHAVPLLLCRGLSVLRSASVLTLVIGVWTAFYRQQVDHESKMRI